MVTGYRVQVHFMGVIFAQLFLDQFGKLLNQGLDKEIYK